jgi:hypothetical protein
MNRHPDHTTEQSNQGTKIGYLKSYDRRRDGCEGGPIGWTGEVMTSCGESVGVVAGVRGLELSRRGWAC